MASKGPRYLGKPACSTGRPRKRMGDQSEGQIAHSAFLPAPTFRSDFWGLLTGPLLMLPRPKLLVERVEVGLPEPGQLLIIFHSIPPAGQGRAEMSTQLLDSLHSHPLPERLGLQRGCLASFTPPGGSRWNTPQHGRHPLPLTQAPSGGIPSVTATHPGHADGTKRSRSGTRPTQEYPASLGPRPLPPSTGSSFSPGPAMCSVLRRKGLGAPMRQDLPGLRSLLLAPSRDVPFLSEDPKTTAPEQNHQ